MVGLGPRPQQQETATQKSAVDRPHGPSRRGDAQVLSFFQPFPIAIVSSPPSENSCLAKPDGRLLCVVRSGSKRQPGSTPLGAAGPGRLKFGVHRSEPFWPALARCPSTFGRRRGQPVGLRASGRLALGLASVLEGFTTLSLILSRPSPSPLAYRSRPWRPFSLGFFVIPLPVENGARLDGSAGSFGKAGCGRTGPGPVSIVTRPDACSTGRGIFDLYSAAVNAALLPSYLLALCPPPATKTSFAPVRIGWRHSHHSRLRPGHPGPAGPPPCHVPWAFAPTPPLIAIKGDPSQTRVVPY